jgi:hypothetical protein
MHHYTGRWFAAFLLALLSMPLAAADRMFKTPEAAMQAFGDAVTRSDEVALKAMLGENFRQVIPPVDAEARQRFLAAWKQFHTIQRENGRARIAVGTDGWSLPIPLGRSSGGWSFDIKAGLEEMRVRRIGRNELAAVQTMLAIHDAQLDYASKPREPDGLITYASSLESSPGRHDGLYWPAQAGEPPSPLGPAVASAATRNSSPDGYYGYRYKIITSQGPSAAGGARNYLVDGKLLGGFAVIAWPARYRDTGVMSFIMNQDGQVFESDLGADTAATAAAVKSFDPIPGWTLVSP